ncbi:MAG TPA: tyrosine-protein phosphatase [Mariprofundaceae bacterium]|nr:tyrosine-protein phosphatase [Mariprofundaceae bacterium]
MQAAEPRLRPADWAMPVISDHLHNWYKVDDRVYRSEQPDAEGMADLEAMGIRRVLSLREFHGDAEAVSKTHLQSFRIPIDTWHITDDEVVQALRIILASDAPILVHCWHGSDRTGTVIAMYRIVVQGWSRAAAIDELVHGGYHYHSMYGNIITYLEHVDIDAIRQRLKE